jgi:hypothetical protein
MRCSNLEAVELRAVPAPIAVETYQVRLRANPAIATQVPSTPPRIDSGTTVQVDAGVTPSGPYGEIIGTGGRIAHAMRQGHDHSQDLPLAGA